MHPADAALASRIRVASGTSRLGAVPGRSEAPAQVLVKVAGKTKSRRTVHAMVNYIGRLRAEDKANGLFGAVALFDEGGRRIHPEAVRGALEGWDLLKDEDNAMPAARRLDPAARRRLPQRARLRHRQALHLVWSVPGDAATVDPATVAALEAATLAVLDEQVAARGHRAFWCVHTEQADDAARRSRTGRTHPHVHVVIATRSPSGATMEVDVEAIDTLRHALATAAREQGLNVVAERREDRAEVRAEILAGREPLRAGWKRARGPKGDRGDLARRAPLWFAGEGAALLARRKRTAALRRAASAEARRSDVPRRTVECLMEMLPTPRGGRLRDRWRRPPEGDIGRVFDAIREDYLDPHAALESWARAASEGLERTSGGRARLPNLSLANWYLRHYPEVFGEITRNAVAPGRSRRLQAVLAGVRPWAPAAARVVTPQRAAALAEELDELRAAHALARDKEMMAAELERLVGRAEARQGGVTVAGVETQADRIRQAAEQVRRAPLPRPSGGTSATETRAGRRPAGTGGADRRALPVPTAVPRAPGRVRRRRNEEHS